jgi:hypothetical protein
MPSGEDDDLSILRALADDLILDVADRDPARVIKAVVEVCARLAAERHISTQELQTAVEVLLLEWQEQSSGRPCSAAIWMSGGRQSGWRSRGEVCRCGSGLATPVCRWGGGLIDAGAPAGAGRASIRMAH